MSTKVDGQEFFKNLIGPVTFGTFMVAARTSMDLTQAEMGNIFGVSKSVVCDIEKGRQAVSPKLALKIARKAQLSEKVAVMLCLQDQLNRAKIKMKIRIEDAS